MAIEINTFLLNHEFSILDHIVHKRMDYSRTTDFRDKQDLSSEIVKHDLKYIESSDIVIVIVIANGPSYGTAIEMFVAESLGKQIILFAKDPVPTPGWYIFQNI
jgi:nucleoside 2-deoxyribosyltransferase